MLAPSCWTHLWNLNLWRMTDGTEKKWSCNNFVSWSKKCRLWWTAAASALIITTVPGPHRQSIGKLSFVQSYFDCSKIKRKYFCLWVAELCWLHNIKLSNLTRLSVQVSDLRLLPSTYHSPWIIEAFLLAFSSQQITTWPLIKLCCDGVNQWNTQVQAQLGLFFFYEYSAKMDDQNYW